MNFAETNYPIGGFQSDFESAEYVVFGVPLDETASFRAGCGAAPTTIREYSNNLETVNPYTQRDIAEVLIHDAGDLRDDLIAITRSFSKKVRDAGKKLLVLGGEHSILPVIGEVYKDMVFVVFDAHGDLRETYNDDPNSHACAVRRLMDHINPDQLVMIGLRAVSIEERQYIDENNISVYWGHNWNSDVEIDAITEINAKVEKYGGLYLSVDMDGFDPGFAPGVGNPEPLGLHPREFFEFLHQLPCIDASDISELNPSMDPSGASSALAARLAMSILSR